MDSLLPSSKAKALAQIPGKLRVIIELKALRVREKQRALRAQAVERLAHGTLLLSTARSSADLADQPSVMPA